MKSSFCFPGLILTKLAAFRPTCICNLAFTHKGFTFNSFSNVFSVVTFQGIVFLESFLKRWFPQVQLWQIKQWKTCYLSKTAVIKTETFCRRVRLRQMLQILQRIEKLNKKRAKTLKNQKCHFFSLFWFFCLIWNARKGDSFAQNGISNASKLPTRWHH